MTTLGIPTPSPTPIAILSLVDRPEEPVLVAFPEELPLLPVLPVVPVLPAVGAELPAAEAVAVPVP
jgi:hypothetical protein